MTQHDETNVSTLKEIETIHHDGEPIVWIKLTCSTPYEASLLSEDLNDGFAGDETILRLNRYRRKRS